MNKRQSRIHCLYEQFIYNLGKNTISEYFQIKTFECKLTKNKINPEEFIFEIYEEIMPNYLFPTLPNELSVYISKYLFTFQKAKYSIRFPMEYPFKPPIWDITYFTNKKYLLAKYYLNKQYEVSWSPALSFEKDVLNMICAISIH